MSIEFPLRFKETPLGSVSDPIIPLDVLTNNGYRRFEFLLDSGADCTVVPKYMSHLIGINLHSIEPQQTYGLRNDPLIVYPATLNLRIRGIFFQVRCLITDKDDTSLLLGRLDLFPHFNITFDNRRHKIIFSEILSLI